MRGVFDTVVLVRGLINPFSRWGRLLFDHGSAYQLVVAPPVVAEYLDVLHRPELVRKYRRVAARDPHAVLDLVARATVVELLDLPRISRDPEDDKFLATAKAGGVAYIVTEDADLLDIGEYEGTQIVMATTFLRLLPPVVGSP